jgi:hypothetical protein
VKVFAYSDVKFTKRIGVTGQQKEWQWSKTQVLVREMRKIQAVFTAVFKAGIPSGKQLQELLEKMRAAVYLASQQGKSANKDERAVNDNDDQLNDDIDTASTIVATVPRVEEEDEPNAEAEEAKASEDAASAMAPKGWMSPALFAFLLLGPLSQEPLDLMNLGMEPPVFATAASSTPSPLVPTNLRQVALVNAGGSSDGNPTSEASDRSSSAVQKRKVMESISEGTTHIRNIACTYQKRAKVDSKEKQLNLAREMGLPIDVIAKLQKELYELYEDF